MIANIRFMVLKNIKKGQIVGIHPNLGGAEPAEPSDKPIGVARRDLYAGETIEVSQYHNTKDILAKADSVNYRPE